MRRPTPACPVTKLGPGHTTGQPANGQGKKAASKRGQPARQANCQQTGPLGRPRIRGSGNRPFAIHVQTICDSHLQLPY